VDRFVIHDLGQRFDDLVGRHVGVEVLDRQFDELVEVRTLDAAFAFLVGDRRDNLDAVADQGKGTAVGLLVELVDVMSNASKRDCCRSSMVRVNV
jgi:hypothetical protein